MPFEIKSFDEMIAQAVSELRRQNADLDPTIFGSFALAFLKASAALGYSVQQEVIDLSVQLFPQTAQGEFLERWAGYENLERLPSSSAEGSISIEGNLGITIPSLTPFLGSNGLFYESQLVSTVTDVNQVIQSLVLSGSTVTATLADDHTLATGITVTISGADPNDYNGTFVVTVIARNQFTYEILTSPSDEIGSPVYVATYAGVLLQSVDAGTATNAESGAVFSPDPALVLIDASGFAQIDGMSGGADEETDALLRVRTILSRSLLEGVFTPDQVKLAALSIAGNTRAFVVTPELSTSQAAVPVLVTLTTLTQAAMLATATLNDHGIANGQFVLIADASPTDYNGTFLVTVTSDNTFTYDLSTDPASPAMGTITATFSDPNTGFAGMLPAPGQVVVYILRDDDANIIPTQTVLDNTKAEIIADGALPANSSEADVFVLAPTIVEQNFVFASIDPDTPTMRTAVQQQLEAFFEDTIDFEQTITEASYLGAIQNTQDLETGDLMEVFDLTTPSEDITVDSGEIAVLGTVTFT